MKFKNVFAAGFLVQIVNVLGNYGLQQSGLFHQCQHLVCFIGFSINKKIEKYFADKKPAFFLVLEVIT
jgi:hypothetical protein